MRPSFSVLSLLAVVFTSLWGCSSLAAPDEWSSAKEKKANALFKELCATKAKEAVYQVAYEVNGYLWESPWSLITEIGQPDYIALVRNPNLPSAADFCPICLRKRDILGPTFNYMYIEIKLPGGDLLRLDELPNRYDSPIVSKIPVSSSRYVVSFRDEATPEMRALWISGSKLQIKDLTTGVLLGERISFARGDPSLKNSPYTTGPWARTVRCPADPQFQSSFILKVLNENSQVNHQ